MGGFLCPFCVLRIQIGFDFANFFNVIENRPCGLFEFKLLPEPGLGFVEFHEDVNF